MHFDTQEWTQNVAAPPRKSDYVTMPSTVNDDGNNLWSLLHYSIKTIRNLENYITNLKKELSDKNSRIQELEKLSIHDELTQILNRRGFDNALDKELDRLYRNKKDTSLILMIDLNNFKSINDTHGHSFGDQALKLVAKTIEHNIRTMDVAARLGGDEFGVLLTQAKTDKALDRVQDLARKLNSLTIRSGNKIIRLSASIGISPIKAGDTAENILNIADQRMYDDKRKRKKTKDKKEL